MVAPLALVPGVSGPRALGPLTQPPQEGVWRLRRSDSYPRIDLADHRLDEHLTQAGPEGVGQRTVGTPHVLVGGEIEPHPAGVALVYQPGNVRLEHDPATQVSGDANRLLLAGDRPGVDHRNPVAGEQFDRFCR